MDIGHDIFKKSDRLQEIVLIRLNNISVSFQSGFHSLVLNYNLYLAVRRAHNQQQFPSQSRDFTT
jgi:hypothetical protein